MLLFSVPQKCAVRLGLEFRLLGSPENFPTLQFSVLCLELVGTTLALALVRVLLRQQPQPDPEPESSNPNLHNWMRVVLEGRVMPNPRKVRSS